MSPQFNNIPQMRAGQGGEGIWGTEQEEEVGHPTRTPNPKPGTNRGTKALWGGSARAVGLGRGARGCSVTLPFPSRDVATGGRHCTARGVGGGTAGPARGGGQEPDTGTSCTVPASPHGQCRHPHARVPKPPEHARRRDAETHFSPNRSCCRVVRDPLLLLPHQPRSDSNLCPIEPSFSVIMCPWQGTEAG